MFDYEYVIKHRSNNEQQVLNNQKQMINESKKGNRNSVKNIK